MKSVKLQDKNTQKSVAFLCSGNYQENKIIPFIVTSKGRTFLGINLKEMKDLYIEIHRGY